MQGKEHEIRELVNALTEKLRKSTQLHIRRETISKIVGEHIKNEKPHQTQEEWRKEWANKLKEAYEEEREVER